MTNYPEHEKLKAVQDKSQAIGEFMDWLLNEQGYVLGKYKENWLYPTYTGFVKLIAEYFEIDQHKLEEEKSQMLSSIRKLNNFKD